MHARSLNVSSDNTKMEKLTEFVSKSFDPKKSALSVHYLAQSAAKTDPASEDLTKSSHVKNRLEFPDQGNQDHFETSDLGFVEEDEALPLVCHKKETPSPVNLNDSPDIDSNEFNTHNETMLLAKDDLRKRVLGFPSNIPNELHRLANLSQLHNLSSLLPPTAHHPLTYQLPLFFSHHQNSTRQSIAEHQKDFHQHLSSRGFVSFPPFTSPRHSPTRTPEGISPPTLPRVLNLFPDRSPGRYPDNNSKIGETNSSSHASPGSASHDEDEDIDVEAPPSPKINKPINSSSDNRSDSPVTAEEGLVSEKPAMNENREQERGNKKQGMDADYSTSSSLSIDTLKSLATHDQKDSCNDDFSNSCEVNTDKINVYNNNNNNPGFLKIKPQSKTRHILQTFAVLN
ncbi:uncharacterized protein LOC125178728 [Hyalella azteca]|uniref:Uncharacterized protein LOC125178728 n=1 Tax=Hyalella azteca TaxID=294128 RepID=A0A979FPX0_HYAAZ|nr:uncharacterized protein LOC125178728 [Hyalella azteca]